MSTDKTTENLERTKNKITKSLGIIKSRNTSGTKGSNKTKPLVISLTILLLLSAFYFFLYMEREGKKFDARRFRVLASMAENIHKKEEGFGRLIKDLEKELLISTADFSKPAQLEFLNNVIEDFNEQYRYNNLIVSYKNLKIEGYLKYTAPESSEFKVNEGLCKLSIYYKLSNYLDEAIPKSTFENLIILEDPDEYYQDQDRVGKNLRRTILFQDLENGAISYTSTDHLKDTLLTTEYGLSTGNVKRIELNGILYRMYVHVEHDKSAELNINIPDREYKENAQIFCGLIGQKEFNSYRRKVDIWFVIILSILLLLVVISLPLLKAFLMNDIERLRGSDIILSGTSIIIGAPLLLLVLLSLWAYSDYYLGKQKNELRDLAFSIDNSVHQEVGMILRDLYNDSIPKALKASLDRSNIGTDGEGEGVTVAFERDSSDNGLKHLSYHALNEYYGMADSGKQVFSITTYTKRKKLLDLSDREYFKRLSSGVDQLWQYNDQEIDSLDNERFHHKGIYEYFMEPVTSWTTGDHEAVIAIKLQNGIRVGNERKKETAQYLAISTKLNSLIDPILPNGYGFAVVDSRGNTLFHSNDSRIQSENFLEETNDNSRLRSALFGNRDEYIQTIYWGERVRMHVRPSRRFPFYIITFYEQEHIRVFTAEIVSMGIVISAISFVLLALVVYLTALINKEDDRKLISSKAFAFNWLQPTLHPKEHFQHSKSVMIGYGVIYLLFIGLFRALGFWNYSPNVIALGLLLPAFCFITNFWMSKFSMAQKTAPGGDPFDTAVNKSKALKLVITFLISSWLHFVLEQDIVDFGWVISTGLYVVVVLIYLLITNIGKERLKSNSQRDRDRWRNTLLLTIHLILLETFNLLFWSIIDNPFYLLAIVAWGIFILYRMDIIFSKNVLKKSLPKVRRFLPYSNFLFTWLMVATLVPAFVNFCTVHTIEKFVHNRYKQLKAARQIEDKIYNTFQEFYNEMDEEFLINKTRTYPYLFQSGLKAEIVAKKDGNAPDFKSNDKFKELLYNARPNYHNTIVENKTALYQYSDSHNWHWGEDDSQTLQYDLSSAPGSFKDTRILVESDQDFFVFGTDSKSKIFVVIIIGFLFLLYRIIKKLYRFVFSLWYFDYGNHSNIIELKSIYKLLKNNDRSLLIFPAEYFKELFKADSAKELDEKLYMVRDLEEVIYDPSGLTEEERGKKVILLTNRYPYILASELDDEAKTKLQSALYNCNQIIVNHLALKSIVEDQLYEDQDEFPQSYNNQILEEEMNSSAFFLNIKKLRHLFKKEEIPGLKRSKIILRMQQAAYNHYTDIWESLSQSEKYILYDMAEDGFMNTKNAQSVISLMDKGLIHWADNLRIMNRSFANFILTAIRKEEGQKIERERTVRGSWSNIRVILYLIIAAVFVFIALGEPDFFDDFNALITVIAGIITLFPIIGGLFSTEVEDS